MSVSAMSVWGEGRRLAYSPHAHPGVRSVARGVGSHGGEEFLQHPLRVIAGVPFGSQRQQLPLIRFGLLVSAFLFCARRKCWVLV